MAILKELAGKAVCAVERAKAVQACAHGRAEAAKLCAVEKAEAVTACAKARLKEAASRARLRFQLAGGRVQMWMLEFRQARVDKANLANFNRSMHELECQMKKKDYQLRLKEYEQWRIDQAEIKIRDIYTRMQKLNMIDASVPFPRPMRPDLYDRKTSPLLPQKPLVESYSEYLKSIIYKGGEPQGETGKVEGDEAAQT